MSKSYCKWPVIIGIILIVGIILSVLICVIRCACCGLDCCCGIFSCCRSRRPKRSKYADSFTPAPYQGYQPTPNPAYNPGRGGVGAGAGSAPAHFATFDVSRKGGKVNDDALPAMPSWDQAKEHKVYEEEQKVDSGMEMGRLDPQKEPMLANQQVNGIASPGYRDTEMRFGNDNNGHLGQTPFLPQQQSALSPTYQHTQNPLDHHNGSDLGAGTGGFSTHESAYDNPYTHQMPTGPSQIQYHSPDSFTPPPAQPQHQYSYQQGSFSPQPSAPSAYSGYTPSSSTRYEPSEVSAPAAYPGMPAYGQQGGVPPGALQAGRRPAQGGWVDV